MQVGDALHGPDVLRVGGERRMANVEGSSPQGDGGIDVPAPAGRERQVGQRERQAVPVAGVVRMPGHQRLVERQGLAVEPLGVFDPAIDEQQRTQPLQGEGVGRDDLVTGPVGLGERRERRDGLFVERPRPGPVPPRRAERPEVQVALCGRDPRRDVRRVLASQAIGECEMPRVGALGVVGVPSAEKRAGEVIVGARGDVHRDHRIPLPGQDFFTQPDGLFEGGRCARQVADVLADGTALHLTQPPVPLCEFQFELIVTAGVSGQAVEELHGAAEQQAPGLCRAGQRAQRLVHLEEQGPRELPDLPEAVLGPVALDPRDAGLPRRGRAAAGQAQHRHGGRRHGDTVPHDELAHAVAQRGGRCGHGPAVHPCRQVRQEPKHRWVAVARVLAERLQHDDVEVAAQRGAQGGRRHAARPGRLGLADGAHRLEGRQTDEFVGRALRKEPIGQHTQRVHVGGRGHRIAPHLFRARVLGREAALARAGLGGAGAALLGHQGGDAEVEQFRVTIRGDQDVGGLQVAMDHQMLVRMRHGVAHGEQHLHAPAGRRRVGAAPGVDRLAVDVLHHEYGTPSSAVPASSRRAMLG